MRVLNCDQGCAQWLKARQGIPTGSSLANIVTPTGKATSNTKRETYKMEKLWERITNSCMEHYVNPAMERGTKLEKEAREYFEMVHNVDVEQVGFCMHDKIECGISPDGLFGKNDGLEIKTATAAPYFAKLIANKVPTCNMVQIQACLWVTERDRWHFLLYDDNAKIPNMEFIVQRDDAVINALEIYVPVFIAELDAAEAALRERYGLPERQAVDLSEYSHDWVPWAHD